MEFCWFDPIKRFAESVLQVGRVVEKMASFWVVLNSEKDKEVNGRRNDWVAIFSVVGSLGKEIL